MQGNNLHPSVIRFAPRGAEDKEAFLKKVARLSQSPASRQVSAGAITFKLNVENMTNIVRALREFGVVCLTDVVPETIINAFNAKFDRLMSTISLAMANSDDTYGSAGGVDWQRNLAFAKDFNALVEHEAPIVNVRGSHHSDTGMRDVFNVQKMTEFNSDPLINRCSELFMSGQIQQLIHKVSPFLYTNTQLYESHSVTDTRGFHIDNIFGTHKAFLYLTDVNSDDDGPYCYAPGTHRLPYLHRLELRYTERLGIRGRDMVSGNYVKSLKFLAPKGTLIISNQTGIHRGVPQREGSFRRVLVGNFSEHNKLARSY